MTVKIRIMGTPEECRAIVAALTGYSGLRSVSDFYPNRGKSVEGRVYVEVDL